MRRLAYLWLAAGELVIVSSAVRAQPMPAEPLTLEVDLASGRMRILASPEVGLHVNAYSIESPSGSLHPGRLAGGAAVEGDYNGGGLVEQADLDLVLLNWGDGKVPPGWANDLPVGAIDQAELDGVLLAWGATGGEGWLAGNLAARGVDRLGDGAGESWEVLVASEHQLFEAFLFGDTHFEPGRSEPLGEAFDVTAGAPDIEFLFAIVGGTELTGRVVYASSADITAVGVPEPTAYVLLSIVLFTYLAFAVDHKGRVFFVLASIICAVATNVAAGARASPTSNDEGAISMDDVVTLAAQLRSSEVLVRKNAAESLAKHGGRARAAAIELTRAVADPDEAVREAAVAALEDLGPPREEDLQDLAGLLAGANADTAYWAATLIGRARTDASSCVQALASALKTRSESAVRERVVWALGEIGPPAATASATIEATAAAADCPPRLARLCRQALQSIGGRS